MKKSTLIFSGLLTIGAVGILIYFLATAKKQEYQAQPAIIPAAPVESFFSTQSSTAGMPPTH